MRIGAVTLTLLSDGAFREDGGAFFGLVPRVVWQDLAAPDSQNRLLLDMRCLLIETPTERILVDTGYGDLHSAHFRAAIALAGERRLLRRLEALGIAADDVDLVINTHLHDDHCGGNAVRDAAGRAVPAFPRATYCVQRLELEDALHPNELTRDAYRPESVEALASQGLLQVLDGDTRLTGEVRVIGTPGHTRAHQSVIVESEGQTAVFLGDVASWPVQLERLAWVAGYDLEPMVSIETKRTLARWAVERRALLIFPHHPTIGAGYLAATERADRFRLEPVAL